MLAKGDVIGSIREYIFQRNANVCINFETLLELFFHPSAPRPLCGHRAFIKIEEGVYVLFFCLVKVMVFIFLSCEKSY